LSLDQVDDVLTLARLAFAELGCRGLARVDVRFNSDNEPQVLEVNPLPGLHPLHSDLPRAAAANGVGYEELIFQLVSQVQ
jgi:D-alanine-D-alanine ligase